MVHPQLKTDYPNFSPLRLTSKNFSNLFHPWVKITLDIFGEI
jgi:hypothetical protein